MQIITKKTLTYFEAVATLVGTIIGAGVLGIPFVVSKVGIFVGAITIAVVAVVIIILHLMVAEVVAQTREPLQLSGLAKKYLGKSAGAAMALVYLFALYGVLLAYIIGEGEVLSAIFGGAAFKWSIIFFVVFSFIVVRGIQLAKHFELILGLCLLIIVILISVYSLPASSIENLKYFSSENIFLPFGVILFGLYGASAIPILELVEHKKSKLKSVVILGTVIPVVVYFLFTLTTLAVTGLDTTQIATIGLGRAIGQFMVKFGNLFAFFAMSTSFIAVSLAIVQVFEWDFHLPRRVAQAMVALPFILFLFGVRSFIGVLGAVGSVILTLESLLIIFMFLGMKRKVHGKLFISRPYFWSILLILVFLITGIFGVAEWFF